MRFPAVDKPPQDKADLGSVCQCDALGEALPTEQAHVQPDWEWINADVVCPMIDESAQGDHQFGDGARGEGIRKTEYCRCIPHRLTVRCTLVSRSGPAMS
jgi:hypothetical protein